jgi:hypothetical protein
MMMMKVADEFGEWLDCRGMAVGQLLSERSWEALTDEQRARADAGDPDIEAGMAAIEAVELDEAEIVELAFAIRLERGVATG